VSFLLTLWLIPKSKAPAASGENKVQMSQHVLCYNMSMFTTKSKKKKLSLQITDQMISALELGDHSTHSSISHTRHVQLDPGVVHGGRLQKPGKLKSALHQLFAKQGKKSFTQNSASVILPESLHTYHMARVSGVDTNHLLMADKLANAFFPGLEERWQYSVNKHENGKQSHICLRGIQKEDVEAYEKLFDDFGLGVDSVLSPSDAGLSFYYERGIPAEPGIWFWVGPTQSEIALYDVVSTIASETIPFGTTDLETQLRRELGLSKSFATSIWSQIGARKVRHQKSLEIQRIIHEWMKPFFIEAKSFGDLARTVHQVHPGLLVCGMGATVPHFSELVADYAGLEVRSHRSQRKILGSSSVNDYYRLAPLIGASLK
jgi:Tfp pilus assembly PilM family ATPase